MYLQSWVHPSVKFGVTRAPCWQVLFDFPRDPSEYVRRAGRVSRGAGGSGVVSILVLGRQASAPAAHAAGCRLFGTHDGRLGDWDHLITRCRGCCVWIQHCAQTAV